MSFAGKAKNLDVLREKSEDSDSDSDSDSSDSDSSESNLSVQSVNEIKFQDSIEKEEVQYDIKLKDYILLLIYAIASNTESVVYFTFFLNNWMYCSLESLVFPLSALSYGMILFPRPPSGYFRAMLYYTVLVFFIKLMVQLEVWSILLGYKTFQDFHDPFKIGFNLAKNTHSLTLFYYILWDVVVIISLLLHNFYLIKVGLWHKTETEIESLNEAKERLGLKSRETYKKEVNKKRGLIENLLPSNKEEKPGRDYYAIAITTQMLILVYIFFFFTKMDGNSQDISQAIRSNQFQGRMIVVLIIQLSLIIIERYFYVSRTAQALTEAQKTKDSITNTTPVSRFRSSTAYGSDILSRVPKTQTVNLNFKEVIKNKEKSQKSIQFPPLLRILVFLFLLIAVHLIVFFYLPFNGNYSSSGNLYCLDFESRCNDFQTNGFLQGFYFLYLVYLVSTALQIKHSLPSFSRITFPLMRKTAPLNYYLFLAYRSAPFLFEIRTLMDWTFSNTALTIFQWFKFEDIYAQLFINECYQVSMKNKPHGDPIPKKQKFFMGICGLFTILVIIFIPLIVFSSINPITVPNPVYSASLKLNFHYDNRKFELFSINSVEEIEPVSQDSWDNLYNFTRIHQLSSTDREIMQKVIMPADSDQIWGITPPAKIKLCNNIRDSKNDAFKEASLVMKYSFYREYPVSKTEITMNVKKIIEKEILNQFENIICLNQNSSIFIPKVFDEIIRLPSSGDKIVPLTIKSENFTSGLILTIQNQDNLKWWNISAVSPLGQKEGVSYFTISDSYSFVTLNFSILTFYISVVYVLGSLIKLVTKGSGRNVVMTDMTCTKDLQVLCEGIYISRMIGKIKEEEELYFELLDILRSPEITKMITGSSSIKTEQLDKKNR